MKPTTEAAIPTATAFRCQALVFSGGPVGGGGPCGAGKGRLGYRDRLSRTGEHVERGWLVYALERVLTNRLRVVLGPVADQPIHFFADYDLACGRDALDAGGQVDAVAVYVSVFGRDDLTDVDADTQATVV